LERIILSDKSKVDEIEVREKEGRYSIERVEKWPYIKAISLPFLAWIISTFLDQN
jgi:hypothetical protein